MLVTRAAKELVAQVITHPGTSHSGHSLTLINSLAIKVSTVSYHVPSLKLNIKKKF